MLTVKQTIAEILKLPLQDELEKTQRAGRSHRPILEKWNDRLKNLSTLNFQVHGLTRKWREVTDELVKRVDYATIQSWNYRHSTTIYKFTLEDGSEYYYDTVENKFGHHQGEMSGYVRDELWQPWMNFSPETVDDTPPVPQETVEFMIKIPVDLLGVLKEKAGDTPIAEYIVWILEKG